MSKATFAAIGSDMMAVYEMGSTPDEAIANARRAASAPEAEFQAVEITPEAAAYVEQHGGAPDRKLVVTRHGVSLRADD